MEDLSAQGLPMVPLTKVWSEEEIKEILSIIGYRGTYSLPLSYQIEAFPSNNPFAEITTMVFYCEYEDLPLFINACCSTQYSTDIFKWRMEHGI